MLSLEGLNVRYGGLVALKDVSLRIDAGEFVAIIGANGAGKTTLFKTVSGVVSAQSGTITYQGASLDKRPPYDRARLGIAHVPEGRQVFKDLTVMENIELGAVSVASTAERKRNVERAVALFPILGEFQSRIAGALSGGQQQMLAIARGLASAPKLLLLDEPSMGLAPAVVDQIFDAIRDLRQESNLTTIIVEQRAVEALETCDRGYVLETGKIVASGTRDELMRDDAVRRAYLGC